MTFIKVSLSKIFDFDLNKKRITPLWFTSDNTIRLSIRNKSSLNIALEKLSERSLLELSAARRLRLIEIEKPFVFDKFLTLFNKNKLN